MHAGLKACATDILLVTGILFAPAAVERRRLWLELRSTVRAPIEMYTRVVEDSTTERRLRTVLLTAFAVLR